ncbi:MAG: imidazolonepropionase [Reichenbachiella sp.]
MSVPSRKLVGPFTQILTMDDSIGIIENGGIIINGSEIEVISNFKELRDLALEEHIFIDELKESMVLLPGLIDAHTHICFAGSRAKDYAMRSEGKSYQEIAKSGGGIMNTVQKTRKATRDELIDGILERGTILSLNGVTTCEVKSGYGLTVKEELKMLHAIHQANEQLEIDLVPTALPAHVCPPEFDDPEKYLMHISNELLPEIVVQKLAKRADIFIEEGAFSIKQSIPYLTKCQELGFDLTIHADQFNVGGSQVAIDYNAVSADHLEASGTKEIKALAASQTIATALPGASLGLGMQFAPARKLIDNGVTVCIASDWNPGSAPMGDLLAQASLIGIFEKLNHDEILSGITKHAANALSIQNIGILKKGNQADMIGFSCANSYEILYHQGAMKPSKIWKKGRNIK